MGFAAWLIGNRLFGNWVDRSAVPFTRCSASHAFKPTDGWSDVRLNLIRRRWRQPSISELRRLDEVESISARTSKTIIRLNCESRPAPTGLRGNRVSGIGNREPGIGCLVSRTEYRVRVSSDRGKGLGLSQYHRHNARCGARVVESPAADTSRFVNRWPACQKYN